MLYLNAGQHKMESKARLRGPGQFVLKAVKANWFVMVLWGMVGWWPGMGGWYWLGGDL